MDLIRFNFACFVIFKKTQFFCICIIRFRFASNYSHKFAYEYLILWKKIHVNANIHFRVNIHFRANICFTFSHTGKYSLQNICFEANIHKTCSEFHILANIC
jgi:hypothetical protein